MARSELEELMPSGRWRVASVPHLALNDSQQGARGLVLNRPTNQSLTDFLPDHELDALGKIPVLPRRTSRSGNTLEMRDL